MVTRRADQALSPAIATPLDTSLKAPLNRSLDTRPAPFSARPNTTSSRLHNGLAGFGVLVLVAHGIGLPLAGGNLAADILLVVAGFQLTRGAVQARGGQRVMGQPHPTDGGQTGGRWWTGYLIQAIGPLAAPLVVASLVVGAVAGSMDRLGDREIQALFGAISGLSNLFAVYGIGGLHAIDHMWLIALMMQFAMLAPAITAFGARRVSMSTRMAVLVMLAVAVASTRIGLLATKVMPAFDVALHSATRVDGLLIGAAVALAPRSLTAKSNPVVSTLAAALLLLIPFAAREPMANPVAMWGIATPLIVGTAGLILAAQRAGTCGAIPHGIFDNLVLRWLGQRAISIYAWHRLLGFALETDIGSTFFSQPLPEPELIALQALFALAAGAFSYRYLQLPIRQVAQTFTKPKTRRILGVQSA